MQANSRMKQFFLSDTGFSYHQLDLWLCSPSTLWKYTIVCDRSICYSLLFLRGSSISVLITMPLLSFSMSRPSQCLVLTLSSFLKLFPVPNSSSSSSGPGPPTEVAISCPVILSFLSLTGALGSLLA